jgi:uncharacterized protein YdbL (DUF1318 family)
MNLARLVLIMLVALAFGAPVTLAQENQATIQERMKARITQVDALKLAGLVGENNKGFLEQRGSLEPAQTELMNAENADRRALYNILAGRLGLSVTVVGEQRATNVREKSAAGVWLQGADGAWYKK